MLYEVITPLQTPKQADQAIQRRVRVRRAAGDIKVHRRITSYNVCYTKLLRDPLVKNLDEKKDAIRALGEIASADSWPHLIEVLRKRKLWKRSRYDELRVTAASALANFNHPEVIRALEEATNA